ncbi:MAG: hypothetical protein AAB393_19090, partial [Bacteroidota bacterium]
RTARIALTSLEESSEADPNRQKWLARSILRLRAQKALTATNAIPGKGSETNSAVRSGSSGPGQ